MYLEGRIDIESYLRDEVLALLRKQSQPATIAVDLGAVAYVEAVGIATLIEMLKIVRIGAIAMHLQALQGRLLLSERSATFVSSRARKIQPNAGSLPGHTMGMFAFTASPSVFSPSNALRFKICSTMSFSQ